MRVVNLTPIVGLPQFDGWSQVTIDPSKEFICAFAINGSNAGNVGRDLVDFLDQVKPGSAVELHQLFQQIADQVKQKGCQISLVAGVFIEDVCFLGTYHSSICLKRNDKVGQLVTAEENFKIIEGKVKLGDVFVLVTDGGRNFLEEIQQKLSQGYDVDTIITSVVPSLHNSTNSSLSAVAFAVISDRNIEDKPTDVSQAEAESVEQETIQVINDPTSVLQTPAFMRQTQLEEESFDQQPMLNKLENQDLTVEPIKIDAVPYDPVLTYTTTPINKAKTTINVTGWLAKVKSIPFLKWIKVLFYGIKQLAALIKKWVTKLTSSDVYVNQPDKRKVARLVVICLILIGVLGSGVAFYFYRRDQQYKQVEAAVAPLEAKLEQAKTLVGTDPIVARQQTEQTIMEMQTLADSMAQQKRNQKLVLVKLDEAKQFYDSISGREEFQELPLFYDLRLAKPNFIASKVVFASPNAYFLDAGLAEIVILNTNNKEVSTVSLKSEDSIKDMMVMGKNLYLLGKGLFKLKSGEQEVTKIKDSDEVINEPGLIAGFNDSIYVLSPSKKNIYRYEQTDGKYGDPKPWLKIQPDLDFSQITSWTIDGDVWLVTSNGRVNRFRTGKANNIDLVGLPEELSTSLAIFTTEEDKNIYLLEAKKHRLVVIDKDGKFVKEVKSGSLASATNLVVDEPTNKVFVVSGSLIYSINN